MRHLLIALAFALVTTQSVDARQDARAARLSVLPVQGSVYMISGAGVNITVHIGKYGVVLVDTPQPARVPQVINEIRKHCVEQRENIIVEGTLKWPDQGPDVFSQLADAYYSSVEVLGIEVDPDTAHRQALSRWWSGRTRWVAGTDTLGGRFTPPDAIDGCYPTPHTADALSHCGDHALQLIDLAQSGVIPSVKITIFRPSAAGSLEPTVEKAYLQQPGPPS